jgi:hypothetical protein
VRACQTEYFIVINVSRVTDQTAPFPLGRGMSQEGSLDHHIRLRLSGEYDIARKGELAEALASIASGHPITLDNE